MDTPLPATLKGAVPFDTLANYVVGDVDGTYAFIGQTRDIRSAAFASPGDQYTVTEKTSAAYLQYDLDAPVFGHRVRADAGLRYYSTELTSAGLLDVPGGQQLISVRRRYGGFLPAVNVAVDLTDTLVTRFSANRDIGRPALVDLAVAGSLTTAPFGGTVNTGNPYLKPFTADAVEGSIEFYQGHTFLSAGVFYKKLESFITDEVDVVPYASTGLPLSFLLPGETGATLFDVSRPVNVPGADIWGAEIAVQRDLDFLPTPFEHLGVAANATYADGSADVIFSGAPVRLPLPNLSKYSANLTLYYEVQKWGMRVSASYRDSYLTTTGATTISGKASRRRPMSTSRPTTT